MAFPIALNLASILIALYASSPCCAQILTLVQPHTKQVAIDGIIADLDDGVSPADARAVLRLLPGDLKASSQPSIYRVPGDKDLFLVTADGPHSPSGDYGLCLYVFLRTSGSFKQLFRSKGMNDSYILRPTFFVGPNRLLIMAETGDETGTWGLHGFEIASRKVRFIGALDASRRDPKDPDCWKNPIIDARVELVKDTYVIRLRGRIFLNAGLENARELPGIGWHTFVLENGHFTSQP